MITIKERFNETIQVRLTEIRKTFSLSMEEFGKRIGVAKSTISRLEAGSNDLTNAMIKLICKEFDVSEDWLRFGIGDMKFKLLPEDEYVKAAAEISKNDEDEIIRQVIIEYWKLNPEGKRHIKEYILNVAKSLSKKEEPGA